MAARKPAPKKATPAKRPATRKAPVKVEPEVPFQEESTEVHPSSIQELKSGPREYTEEQYRFLDEAIRNRKDLQEAPLPISDDTPPEAREWIRNLHEIPLALRFDSQKTQGARRTELKPRGSRGDITKLKPEDIESNFYAENIGLAFEALTATEAREVISKQTTNIQQPVHPALAMLRNELDQPYEEGAVSFQEPARDISAGRVQSAQYDADGNPVGKNFTIERGSTSPRIATVPGSPQPTDPDERADAIARSKQIEGPKAGIGDLRVVVEEVQRGNPIGLK